MNIEKLKKIGGSEWIKNGYHRIYFNNISEMYGLKCSYYNTGNICSASMDGNPISNSRARKIESDLSFLKIWYDVKDEKFCVKTQMRLYGDQNEYFKTIVDVINRRVEEGIE